MSGTAISLTPTVTVGGQPLAQQWLDSLVELRVWLGLRVPARATLRFADAGYGLAASSVFDLGTEVAVEAYDQGALLRGEVTGVQIEQHQAGHPEFVAVVHDRAARLGRSNKVKAFVDMTYSDIVSALASDAGLLSAVDSTGSSYPYVLQADSDLAFLDSLATRTGYDWWVDDKTLHFKKPAPNGTVTLQLGETLREFSVRASALHPTSIEVHGWDRDGQRAVSGSATVGSSDLSGTSQLVDGFVTGGPGSGATVTAAPTPTTAAEAATLAASAAQRWAAGAVVARGVCEPDARVKPAAQLTIEHAGPVSGTYYVTEVEHVFRLPRFETRFVAGDRAPAHLADTLGARHEPRSFTHAGLVVGTVTNINDADKRGRVKVMFSGVSGDVESAWARLATLGAGKKRGLVFLPEVGDEVVVGFEGGDPRQPVVLGGVFGEKSTIPAWDVDQGTVGARQITSRLGHVIELGDGTEPSKQFIVLSLVGNEHRLRVGKDTIELVGPAGIPVKIAAGNSSIEFSDSGAITMTGTDITIKANQKLTLQGMNVAVEGQLATDVKGTQVSVKGEATVAVEASGVTTVKGAAVQIN